MTSDALARQIAHIEHALTVFHPAGDVVELRALGVAGRKAVSFISADLHALAVRAAELDGQGATGCYFTPNPLKPELAGHAVSARKDSVLERRWLLIDCDSDKARPASTNATDVEKEAGWR